MTAEIAIMNKSAVALAADTVVTIGSAGGIGKTFDTVNKIFTISKVFPVGVMISNNAEWGADFISYLRGFGEVRTGHIRANLTNVLNAWFSDVRDTAVIKAREASIRPSSDEYISLLISVVEQETDKASAKPSWLTGEQLATFSRQYQNEIISAVRDFCKRYDNQELVKKALSLALMVLVNHSYSPISTEIAIAGFGTDDLFPKLVHYETDGHIGKRVKVERRGYREIAKDNTAWVLPFAQKDMVHLFMNGVYPDYAQFLTSVRHKH